jgi:hypothetical protein
MAVVPKLFPFVFFGCWNQPGYEANTSRVSRDTVATAVKDMSAEIQTIVIGGDNVYPRPLSTQGKNKFHDPAVFDEGFRMYASMGKSIYLAFGNHNESTLDHQKAVVGFRPEDKTYYAKEFDGGIHIVVLDTNIMNNKIKAPAEYEEMVTWFKAVVSDIQAAGQMYYTVQHEPYFTARKKNLGSLVNGEIFLEIMMSYPPISILCADTHHYQHATIQQNGGDTVLHQFTVGTGGANPDLHLPGFVSETIGPYIYSNIDEQTGFGFLRVDAPDPRAATFIKVAEWPPHTSGGRRRTRGRRYGAGRDKRTRRSSK